MSALAEHLRTRIAAEGPITVADFMAEALGNPRHGYYTTRDPLGARGDFVTAPEISQVFGELIGAWCAAMWDSMGRPAPVAWVELGPGRGTLMADAFRAARTMPGFLDACEVHLVEASPALAARQRESLEDAPVRAVTWWSSLAEVPRLPVLLVANEFFDALPVRQYVRTASGWCERLVGVADGASGFRFVLSTNTARESTIPESLRDAPEGSIVEVSPASVEIAADLGRRIASDGVAGLVIDYGHAASAPGETLQAVRGHAWADVLADPGEADLTAHVDFAALARAVADAGAVAHGPVPQGVLLDRLGIAPRTQRLIESAADRRAAEAILSGSRRLADPDQMGMLFKALAVTRKGAPAPPGFA